ncbi:MAG: RuBisCO large subunit C-terminal-like domain-containing protein [bacterium]|nr:RuBisCO large subunit C-terminal-like domain-containing protein [bacterium]
MNHFFVTYQIRTTKDNIDEIAEDICLEQTVEVVKNLAQDKWIKENIIGKVKEITQLSNGVFNVLISYSDAITGYQLPQLLNILYGNISLKNNIKIVNLSLSKNFLSHFEGPKFGISSIRKILNIKDRPLLAAALKPMGKNHEELAQLAYQLALGGIDIIKDDHGLVDHSFCSFHKRIKACQQAIRKAELKTSKKVLYFPNITDSYENMLENIKLAKEIGVGGFLVSPMIIGFDLMRYLANKISTLPIMAHPAFTGSLFNTKHGISCRIILGNIMRIAGADLVIYPNFGGRFPFTKKVCKEIDEALKKDMFNLKKAFPVPAGGIAFENISKLNKFYGHNVVFLVGSSLYAYSKNLTESVKYFLCKVNNSV